MKKVVIVGELTESKSFLAGTIELEVTTDKIVLYIPKYDHYTYLEGEIPTEELLDAIKFVREQVREN